MSTSLSPKENYVFEKLIQHTGYSRHDLSLDAELEGELGIDSITLTGLLTDIDRDLGSKAAQESHLIETPADIVRTISDSADLHRLHTVATSQQPNASDVQKSECLAASQIAPDNSPSDAPVLTMKDFYEHRSPDLFEKARRFSTFYREKTRTGDYWYGMPLVSRSRGRATIYDTERREAREFIMMGSNNYLGLANHPRVIEAICYAARQYGATHTGSRIIAGTNKLHRELEMRLAAFKGSDDAIVFPSGYSANLGTISALVHRHDAVIVDKLNHMSIVDGCALSGGQIKIFNHNDMAHLESVLRDNCKNAEGKLIVVDGVFSMHGDICDLPNILRIARAYGAKVMVDDAHATGVIGKTGSGTSEHFGLKGQVDLELGTFSKSLSGVGGFVCAPQDVVDYLRFYANSYVFAATIPAHVAAGLIASFDVLESEPERLQQLWTNVEQLKAGLLQHGFNLENTESAIIPVIIGDYEKTLAAGKAVRNRGLYCQTVVYPGVGRGDERLRLSISSEHSSTDLDKTVDILVTAAKEVGLATTPTLQ